MITQEKHCALGILAHHLPRKSDNLRRMGATTDEVAHLHKHFAFGVPVLEHLGERVEAAVDITNDKKSITGRLHWIGAQW